MDELNEQATDDQRHLDAWVDTGDGYTVVTRQVVVKCLWCDYMAMDGTARAAVARYRREHETPIMDREQARHRDMAVQGD